MRQTMAFYEQLQSAAFRDVAEAGGHDRQAFAQLSYLANADLADALNELQQGRTATAPRRATRSWPTARRGSGESGAVS
jgi:hypothetical protein